MLKKVRIALYVITSIFAILAAISFEYIRISHKISLMEKRIEEQSEEIYNLKKRVRKLEQKGYEKLKGK